MCELPGKPGSYTVNRPLILVIKYIHAHSLTTIIMLPTSKGLEMFRYVVKEACINLSINSILILQLIYNNEKYIKFIVWPVVLLVHTHSCISLKKILKLLVRNHNCIPHETMHSLSTFTIFMNTILCWCIYYHGFSESFCISTELVICLDTAFFTPTPFSNSIHTISI
jgi:hypothetical protein